MEKSFETEYVYRMSSDILFMIDGAEMVSVSILVNLIAMTLRKYQYELVNKTGQTIYVLIVHILFFKENVTWT